MTCYVRVHNYYCEEESSLCDRFSMYYDEDYALALQLQEQFATEVGLLYKSNFQNFVGGLWPLIICMPVSSSTTTQRTSPFT